MRLGSMLYPLAFLRVHRMAALQSCTAAGNGFLAAQSILRHHADVAPLHQRLRQSGQLAWAAVHPAAPVKHQDGRAYSFGLGRSIEIQRKPAFAAIVNVCVLNVRFTDDSLVPVG